jgi:hypothetical protein
MEFFFFFFYDVPYCTSVTVQTLSPAPVNTVLYSVSSNITCDKDPSTSVQYKLKSNLFFVKYMHNFYFSSF